MPKKIWSELTPLQLGKYAEYYAKMEFTSYGYDVYSSEIDDHGVDFVIKNGAGSFYEVQVKSVLKGRYVYIPKDKITLDDNHLVCLLLFTDAQILKALPLVRVLKKLDITHLLIRDLQV